MKITKAIIPAAGLGTRFLPATKAQPKEMLPLIDKPAIQYIVEEAVASGIKDLLIVTGRGKRAIEDHFDKSYELEDNLLRRGKLDRLQEIQQISAMANIHYVRQKEPKGLGDAVLCAKHFIGNEPFAVLLGDDIIRSDRPCLQQLIQVHEMYKTSVIGVQQVPYKETSKYGIIDRIWSDLPHRVSWMQSLVEKPPADEAPSNYAIMGRYIFTPQIFDILEGIETSGDEELQLTDAINILNETLPVIAYDFEGRRYDIGDKLGFIKATIDFSLERYDLNAEVRTYIRELLVNEPLILS